MLGAQSRTRNERFRFRFSGNVGRSTSARSVAATNFVLPHPGGPCTRCSRRDREETRRSRRSGLGFLRLGRRRRLRDGFRCSSRVFRGHPRRRLRRRLRRRRRFPRAHSKPSRRDVSSPEPPRRRDTPRAAARRSATPEAFRTRAIRDARAPSPTALRFFLFASSRTDRRSRASSSSPSASSPSASSSSSLAKRTCAPARRDPRSSCRNGGEGRVCAAAAMRICDTTVSRTYSSAVTNGALSGLSGTTARRSRRSSVRRRSVRGTVRGTFGKRTPSTAGPSSRSRPTAGRRGRRPRGSP